MRSVLGWLKSASVAIMVGLIAKSVGAAVVVNISEVGTDVQLTVSGSLSQMPWGGSGSGGGSITTAILSSDSHPTYGGNGMLLQNGVQDYFIYASYSRSSDVIWGDFYHTATSSTMTGLSYFSVDFRGIQIDKSYVFGSAISATATFSNKTLATLGITNPGTYVYTYGNASFNDTVTFNIGSSGSGGGGGGGEVPEPASMAIFGLGALGFAYRARCKNRA
jgi:hypothetical protein